MTLTISAVAAVASPWQTLGIYFSAHWCPPCRGFTPDLIEFYNELKSSRPDDFEIVFVSSDNDVASFNGYYGDMPWLAVPFEDRARNEALESRFHVSGIPTLVILEPSGAVITTKGREKVVGNPGGFPWK